MLYQTFSDPARRMRPVGTRASRPSQIRCPDLNMLITYNDTAIAQCRLVGAYDHAFVKAVLSLNELVGGCSTNITSGLRMANDHLGQTPRGLLRRIWLLTDGQANVETEGVVAEVQRAVRQFTNINTVGFGNSGEFNKQQLTWIANSTHNGRYYEATTVAAIGGVFRHTAKHRRNLDHRGEATAFVIDTSPSMREPMGGRQRIEVLAEAMMVLLTYKQNVWS